jgi:hypothetical protein
MKVTPFETTLAWKEHKGWRRPAVAVGVTRYAIEYDKGGFFTYSYLESADAVRVMKGMIVEGTDTEQYYPFNVKTDIQDTIPVAPAHKDGK